VGREWERREGEGCRDREVERGMGREVKGRAKFFLTRQFSSKTDGREMTRMYLTDFSNFPPQLESICSGGACDFLFDVHASCNDTRLIDGM
jgi:hypothetical protein